MTAEALLGFVEDGACAEAALSGAFAEMLRGEAAPEAVAALLTALRLKGETAAQLVALAQQARAAMIPFAVGPSAALDTCGTGGDGAATFNLSSATALLVAAAGQPVVKHGNRSFSSISGSADAMEALGVGVDAPPLRMEQAFAATGFGFCFAPRHHPALRHVAPVRRALRFRTVFNLVAPLANPGRVPFQLIGVGNPSLVPLMAEAVRQLGTARSVVLHGADGLDEVTLRAETHAVVIEDGRTREETWLAADFGLQPAQERLPRIGSPQESAASVLAVLAGEPHPGTDWALANAGAALWCAGRAATLKEGADLARAAIRSGRTLALLNRLRGLCPLERA